jgi:hypothetical protein
MLIRMESGRFKVFKHLTDWFDEYRLYHRKDGRVHKEGDDLMTRRMGDRSDFIFIALLVAVRLVTDSPWLALLVACVHRTWSNQAIRRELYPEIRGDWPLGNILATGRRGGAAAAGRPRAQRAWAAFG